MVSPNRATKIFPVINPYTGKRSLVEAIVNMSEPKAVNYKDGVGSLSINVELASLKVLSKNRNRLNSSCTGWDFGGVE